MPAAITDKFTEATNGTRPVPTTLTATRAVAATSISCGALTGWPTATAVHFIIYTTDVNGNKVAGSQLDCKGIVSGTTIGSIVYKAGTDAGNSVGAIVEAAPTAAWADDVTEGIMVEHKQTGAHAAITADSLVATGNSTAASHISTGDSQLRSISLETIHSHFTYDFVQSGCVWTGDSYGVNRNASMTAGVVYLSGRRVAVALVTARTFTASKDTYMDVDNTGTITYTEVANNAASPALTAGSVRIGIIVTAAGSIAAVGSVNQGEETKVLPIASSIAYTTTDSLGNLICPRDPQRRIIGYRQIITSFATASTTAVQITGMTCPVIVPTGRKVKITGHLPSTSNAAVANFVQTIWDGTVGSGTQLQASQVYMPTAGTGNENTSVAITTPAAASKTYNLGLHTNTNTATTFGSATAPVNIIVELV